MSERVALVTGGSRGIGRAIAIELARSDLAVAVNFATDVESAKATAEAIQALGAEAYLIQADVTDEDQVEAMFDEVEDALGPVSVLVNNAGIRRDSLALSMSTTDFDDVVRTNLHGPFLCSRRALRAMLPQRFGRIVNIASVAGLRGSPGQANYAAGKAGLIGLTKTMAREVARKNITVNAVAPGIVATDLTTTLPPERFDALVAETPARRAGTPGEVAAAVAYLSSDAASYVNGQVLVIDGGMTA